MRSQSALVVALSLGLLPAAAVAQQQHDQAQPREQVETKAPQVDVSKLPLNLARVQRQLRETVERVERDGTSLRYRIDVFAERPPLVLFGPEVDLQFAPVPNTTPTHQEMLDVMTPKEFRSPAIMSPNLLDFFGGSKNKKK